MKPAFVLMDPDDLKNEVQRPEFMALIEKGYFIGSDVLLTDESRDGRIRNRLGLVMLPPHEGSDGILRGQTMILTNQEKLNKQMERLVNVVIGCFVAGTVIGFMILGYFIHVW